MDHGFSFRPNTQDESMFAGVVIANEYRLPESLADRDLVVDIGMNIGSFGYAALSRGAREVHGFEPDPGNFACARRNLGRYGDRIRFHRAAVWRSDNPGQRIFLNHLEVGKFGPENEVQTGCGHLRAGGGQEVPVVPFDALIRDLTHDGERRVNLLKIDCEGSEYPILFTSRMLHLVDEIIGEYHNLGLPGYPPDHPFSQVSDEARVRGYDRYTIAELQDFLQRQGFETESIPHPTLTAYLGTFTARRRAANSTAA